MRADGMHEERDSSRISGFGLDNPRSRGGAAESDLAVAPAWARAFHELRGDTGSPGEHEADKERIACLEAIISVLIEKNERIRRQLMQSMR
jgi:hypothetical protein